MRKSISEWSFVAGMSLQQRMELAKDAGYAGIEVALNAAGDSALHELGLLCVDSSDDEIGAVRATADRVGIEISSVACGLYWGDSLTSPDPAEAERAKDFTRVLLRSAGMLGVDGVLVIPGCVWSSFAALEVVPYEVAYDRALAAIKELAPVAERHKVRMGLEYVWNGFLLSPLEFRSFIDAVGSEYVGFYMDTGNMLPTGFPEQWIRIMGERIVRVHFKDFRRSVGSLDGFCDLLEGDCNWPEVMRALGEVGYDGWATAEMMPPYAHAPDQLIYQTSRAMDVIFAMQ